MTTVFRRCRKRPALPMNRARILGLSLSVGIAIALSGCADPNVGVHCVFLPTHEEFVVADTYNNWGGWTLKMKRPGKTMLLTPATADDWQCLASGMSAGTAEPGETPAQGNARQPGPKGTPTTNPGHPNE